MDDFINYLQGKDLAPTTQKAYLRYANLFLQWYQKEPENCLKKDVLKYLEHLQNERQQGNITRRNALIGINHYYNFLQQGEAIMQNPTALIKIRGTHKRSLYRIYTPEELEGLCDNFYHAFIRTYDDRKTRPHNRHRCTVGRERNAAMLSFLAHQGATTKELDKLKTEDLDFTKATVKLSGGKKSNARTLPLKAPQIGLLMHYVQAIRPQLLDFFEGETDTLFLPLPEGSKPKTGTENLMGAYKILTRQVRSLDKAFENFKQLRASVITHWLKVEGLRKAQYLAGHRYISSTEKYLPNQIDGLIDDIAKFNPF